MAHFASSETPLSFRESVNFLAMSVGNNETVRRLMKSTPDSAHEDRALSEDLRMLRDGVAAHDHTQRGIKEIGDLLESWNMHKFIPLSRSSNQSGVTMAFYAGDGIVVKVTHNECVAPHLRPVQGSYTPMPGVLPPIASHTKGDYLVEIYPWINTRTVNDGGDMRVIKRYLKRHNLQFKTQDDRLDNIGLLPNGQPAVLDTDAVEVIDRAKGITTGVHNWMTQEIYANFGKLYACADRISQLVSDEPDFELKFHKMYTPPERIRSHHEL